MAGHIGAECSHHRGSPGDDHTATGAIHHDDSAARSFYDHHTTMERRWF